MARILFTIVLAFGAAFLVATSTRDIQLAFLVFLMVQVGLAITMATTNIMGAAKRERQAMQQRRMRAAAIASRHQAQRVWTVN